MGADSSRPEVLNDYARNLIQAKANQLVRNSPFRPSDLDDLQQELKLWLWQRSHHYCPSRGALTTFIDRAVRSAVATILRDRSRLKRRAGLSARSIDEPVGADVGASVMRDLLTGADAARWTGTHVPDDTPERREEAELVQRALATLPAHLAPICSRLMVGMKPAAVARELGISRRQVRKAIEHVRRHFEARGLGDS